MLRLIPRMLALMAVHRHMAASRSTRPPRREQHGVSGGVPITAFTGPLRILAHTPSLRVSLGQLFLEKECKEGSPNGFGTGLGWTQVLQPLARANKRRLMERKIVVFEGDDDLAELILSTLWDAH